MSDLGNNVFETLGDAGKRSVKVAADQAKQAAQTATQQVTGMGAIDVAQTPPSPAQPGDPMAGLPENLQKVAQQQTNLQANPQNSTDPALTAQVEAKKKEEEQAKLAETRSKLKFHMEHYYKPTFEKPQQQEMSVQEKNEREDQEKRIKEQKEFEEMQKKKKIEVPKKGAERKLGIDG